MSLVEHNIVAAIIKKISKFSIICFKDVFNNPRCIYCRFPFIYFTVIRKYTDNFEIEPFVTQGIDNRWEGNIIKMTESVKAFLTNMKISRSNKWSNS